MPGLDRNILVGRLSTTTCTMSPRAMWSLDYVAMQRLASAAALRSFP
jgi:hypothetical protein